MMTTRRGARQIRLTRPHRRNRRSGWHATLALAVCLVALAAVPAPLFAQQATPTSSLTYVFGEAAVFALTFPAEPRPAEARLYLRVAGDPTYSYTAGLEGESITLTRDLLATPLPTFAEVTYWWEYTTFDGVREETPKQVFVYADNRFEWQSITEKNVTLHWIAGERSDMIQGLDLALDALQNITWALQTSEVNDVDIYVYPSQPDLESAMQLSGLAWAGAIVYPERGVVMVAVSPTDGGLLDMDRHIPHELAHKVLHDTLGAQGYASLPTWLVEGLAAHFEARPNPDYAVALTAAHKTGSLIPMAELCAPFPTDTNQALLAYAESASFVTYLRQVYGWSSLRDLLEAYADGLACTTGTKEALGEEITQLDRAWRVWLEQKAAPTPEPPLRAAAIVLLRDTGPWLLLFGALLLPPLVFVLTGRRY